MPITEEEGGRLNAFAKEPEIEVLESKSSPGKILGQFLVFIILLVVALITIKFSIK